MLVIISFALSIPCSNVNLKMLSNVSINIDMFSVSLTYGEFISKNVWNTFRKCVKYANSVKYNTDVYTTFLMRSGKSSAATRNNIYGTI